MGLGGLSCKNCWEYMAFNLESLSLYNINIVYSTSIISVNYTHIFYCILVSYVHIAYALHCTSHYTTPTCVDMTHPKVFASPRAPRTPRLGHIRCTWQHKLGRCLGYGHRIMRNPSHLWTLQFHKIPSWWSYDHPIISDISWYYGIYICVCISFNLWFSHNQGIG